MKEYRKARELAEVYVFGNKNKLTSEDLKTIKQSPFSDVIVENIESSFLQMVEAQLNKVNEQSLPVEKDESKAPTASMSTQRNNRFYSGVSREEIIELIRAIEEKFELGVPYDYYKLNGEELKEFIKTYSQRHIFDEATLSLVLRIAEKQHPEEIMGGLRVNIGR